MSPLSLEEFYEVTLLFQLYLSFRDIHCSFVVATTD